MEQVVGSPELVSDIPRWKAGEFALAKGRLLFLVSCMALGMAELALLKPLPQLHEVDAGDLPLVVVLAASLLLFAACSFIRPWRNVAAVGLSASWLLSLLLAVSAAMREPLQLLAWVAASRSALFGVAAMAIGAGQGCAAGRAIWVTLRMTFGLAMILYACIHWFNHDLISDLIPSWVPGRQEWPWLTASVFALCGAAALQGRQTRPAAFVISLMFASWIVLIHIERTAENITSIFEWSFALSAVALLGVALLVAHQGPEDNPSALPSKV